ncbi:neuronal acetylcholine receptor subunit alpha-3-like [Ylistrum balloti]|uniref:neuronal acetylcholine receptor subunit alpha-3-like n=1 Tax=Ylistrum balloti TaxID=509963 RepID=UPI002905B3F9|nr:neuronal acetylcholine receptor subunit alpha-3-like [Ylistrum balloti]
MNEKKYFKKWVLILIFIVTGNTIGLNNNDKNHKQFIDHLFQNYSSFIKPRKNLSEPVDVNITLSFNSLREIDERLQTMTFIAWMELTWIDEFLILGDGVKSIQIPKSDVWYPDVALFNSIDDPLHISDGQYIVLLEDGRVIWYPSRQYSVRCPIDIRRFPFDVQKCQIRIGAWQSPVWTQSIIDTGKSLNEDDFEENGEWEIIQRTTQPKINPNYSISFVVYEIHFRRRPLYPVVNTLFPVVLLSFLNPLVFMLPVDSGEKMTLCISVLLSFTVFLTVFNDMMPKMSTNISYLSIYLCIQLGMSGIAIVESVYIWRISKLENGIPRDETTNGTFPSCPRASVENVQSLPAHEGMMKSEQGIITREETFGGLPNHPIAVNCIDTTITDSEASSVKYKPFGISFRKANHFNTKDSNVHALL